MKAREFIINVPINIKINGDGDPEIDMAQPKGDDADLDLNPIMVPPLQQDIELKKADLGKNSPVIDKITQDQSEHGAEPEEKEVDTADIINRFKQLIQR